MVTKRQFQVVWALLVLSLIGAGLGAVGAVIGYQHQRDLCQLVDLLNPSSPAPSPGTRGAEVARGLRHYTQRDCR